MTLFDDLPEAVKPVGPQLNEGQQQAYDDILNFLTGQGPQGQKLMWVLKGYAGTGKTFTISRIIAELHRQHSTGVGDYRIAMSAPTHKAVRVMKKFSTFPPNAVHFSTLHSLLGLKAEIDERTGKEKFVESKDPTEVRVEQFNILPIDESSMIPDELFVLLLKHVRRGLKILFIGDPVQIPPVNHLEAIPFKPEFADKYNAGVSELTHVMRQAGENPILRLATAIRMGYKTVPHFHSQTDMISAVGGPQKGVLMIDSSDDEAINQLIVEKFCCQAFKDDPDHMKIIAWRNETVDNFNRLVRNRIYAAELQSGGKLPSIMQGEKLIMDKALVMPDTGRILLATNEEIEVVSHEVRDARIEYYHLQRDSVTHTWGGVDRTDNFRIYLCNVSYFDPFGKKVSSQIRIIHESEQIRMKTLLDTIARAANDIPYGNQLKKHAWRSFFGVQKMFAQVKYNYAITGHKSQGSTYDNVLVLDWDIAYNRRIEERNRIRYVAITRARYLACIQK